MTNRWWTDSALRMIRERLLLLKFKKVKKEKNEQKSYALHMATGCKEKDKKKQRKKESPIPSVLLLRQRWQIRNLYDGRISAKDLGVTCSRRFSVFFTCPCSSLLKPLHYPSSASFFCFLLYLTPFRLASSTDDTYYFMSHWSGHTVIKVIMLARWESRRYFYMLVWRNAHLCISVSQNTTWRHSLILLISNPSIILHFVTTFLYSHCESFPKGFPPILLTSRIFPCFFFFQGRARVPPPQYGSGGELQWPFAGWCTRPRPPHVSPRGASRARRGVLQGVDVGDAVAIPRRRFLGAALSSRPLRTPLR